MSEAPRLMGAPDTPPYPGERRLNDAGQIIVWTWDHWALEKPPKLVELRRPPEVCRDEGHHDWEPCCDDCLNEFWEDAILGVVRNCERCGYIERYRLVTDA